MITRGKEGGSIDEEGKSGVGGCQVMGMERDFAFAWGDGHTMQCTDDVLLCLYLKAA